MIIRSIRLKNIKSYGEGPDGGGVTVEFQPGVNRIAGRNGHGKTSLIESLGYALFLSEPKFEESFKTDRYLLRSGTKAGEIDVTFEHEGATYRVERGLGPASKRRAKVVDCADQSISAEGDAEVAQFLCETLRLPHPEQLAEIFSKLVGVKQGRLTWPFDSKPSEAKRFFEPLFDVAVFRDCFERLKPAVDTFQNQAQEQKRLLAVETQKITDRAGSVQQLAEAEQEVTGLEKTKTDAAVAREAARTVKELRETQEKALTTARTAQEKATVTLTGTRTRLTDAMAQLKEAENAAGVLRDTEPAHRAFQQAEQALNELEQQRILREALQKQRDAVETNRKDRASKAVAAREQAQTFSQQGAAKEAQRKGLETEVEPLRAKLLSSKLTFEQAQLAAATASQDRSFVQAWIKGLASALAKSGTTAMEIHGISKELAAWDAAAIATARNAEVAAGTALKSAEGELAKAQSSQTSLQQQLKDIAGGMCPFLKESCRQFDPAKVQSDLDAQAVSIRGLEKKVAETAPLHAAAKKNLKVLEASETRLGAKREQQRRDIGRYVADFATLLRADVIAARDRLKSWEPKLSAAPALPAPPASPLGSAQVAGLQSELEQFEESVAAWWNITDAAIATRLQVSDQEKTARQAEGSTLDHLSAQVTALEKEIASLLKNATAKTEEATRLDTEGNTLAQQVEGFDTQLKPFAGLDVKMAAQRQHRDANRTGHERYLQAKRLADDLVPRQQRFQARDTEEKAAALAAEASAAALTAALAAHDATKLVEARADFQLKHDAVTTIENNLQHARAPVPVAERRVAEWRAACAERDRLVLELARLDAAVGLTELARNVLKNAAPAVAQHLCNRIAGRAQTLFNQINPDPIQLTWEAERYSLTITPGDRRFAMLSGGEQTKLALTLTLAMIEEFGGLRFCIFDEPTYGVDAESRQKLADAILDVQTAAGLDQLLLVSHDDAFEGKSEHTILLTKSVAAGSAVATAA